MVGGTRRAGGAVVAVFWRGDGGLAGGDVGAVESAVEEGEGEQGLVEGDFVAGLRAA